MTVTSTTNRVSYTGDGSTKDFAVPFEFFAEDELQVIERVIATGAETTKMLNSDYTVEDGSGATGTVKAITAPAATVSWTVVRSTKQTQEIDYTDNDPFPASTHEDGLDRATMIAQDSKADTDRALKFPVTDSESLSAEIPNSVLRASKFLAFDSSGLPIASAGPTGDSSIPVSSFIETLLDDADAAIARTTLGAISTEDANTFSKTQTWSKGADIASAAALAPGTDGNYFDVTGMTAITSIASVAVGTEIKLHFDGALTLTHHATDLILPGGANIITAAGDEAEFIEYATGDWRCTSYQKANGEPVASQSGQWKLLATKTASSSATLDFTEFNNELYIDYEMVLDAILPATNDQVLRLVISTDGGSNYDSAASDYGWMVEGGAQQPNAAPTATTDIADNALELTGTLGVSNVAGAGVSGEILFINPGAAARCTALWTLFFERSTGEFPFINGGGRRLASADVDAARLLFVSGNIASGTVRLYGRRR